MTSTYFINRLWTYAPLSWALIRTQECELLSQQKFKHQMLEVGCGDGLVSSIVFKKHKNSIDLGIDLDSEELRQAKKTGVYRRLLVVDITNCGLKSKSYNTIFANGVLDHIPNLDAAISEISRLLKPGGVLITTSPTNNYARLLFYYRLFQKIGLKGLAINYGRLINRVFAHIHQLTQKQWVDMCNKHGMFTQQIVYYNNSTLIALHDLLLPFMVADKYMKRKIDSMVLFPKARFTLFS